MAAVDIEAIWVALFSRLSSALPDFRRFSRRRRDFPIEEQPALLVLDDSGDESLVSNADDPHPPIWRLTGEIVILARVGDTDTAPTAELNGLIRAVRNALERAPTDPLGTGAFYGQGHVQHHTNLGGLVRYLAVTKVEKGKGELTGQAVAKLSIEMETVAL